MCSFGIWGIGSTSTNSVPGQGGTYVGHGWGVTCQGCSATSSASYVIGWGTWKVCKYYSLAGVNLLVVDTSRWSTTILWGFGE